jgi:hypothetical protein
MFDQEKKDPSNMEDNKDDDTIEVSDYLRYDKD